MYAAAISAEPRVEEEFAVAFHAEDGRVDEVEGLAAEVANGGFDAVDGELVGGGVAYDAAFADVLAASLELRLDEEDGFPAPVLAGWGERGDDGGKHQRGGDKADVHGEEGDVLGGSRRRARIGGGWVKQIPFGNDRKKNGRRGWWDELAGGEEAGVGAFEEGDAGVGAELVVDLAVAGVDSEDGGGAVLEHAVGEAAGGGADVGAGEAGDGDVPGGEGGFELEAAARDVAEVVAEEAEVGGVVDERARFSGLSAFFEALLVDEDAAGEDERLGSLARGGEGAVNEELVETKFHDGGAEGSNGQDNGVGERMRGRMRGRAHGRGACMRRLDVSRRAG